MFCGVENKYIYTYSAPHFFNNKIALRFVFSGKCPVGRDRISIYSLLCTLKRGQSDNNCLAANRTIA